MTFREFQVAIRSKPRQLTLRNYKFEEFDLGTHTWQLLQDGSYMHIVALDENGKQCKPDHQALNSEPSLAKYVNTSQGYTMELVNMFYEDQKRYDTYIFSD